MGEINGVWRTVGGRRIFIKDGQDLATAMKESGKFKTLEVEKIKSIQEAGYNQYDELDANSKDLLEWYTIGDGMYINQIMRGFEEKQPGDDMIISDIDKAFEKASLAEDTTVYRGLNNRFCSTYNITLEDIDKAIYENDITIISNKLGTSMIEKGLMSTSLDLESANAMICSSTNIIMELEAPKGAKGLYLGKNSAVDYQEEITFAPNAKINYTSVEVKEFEYQDEYDSRQTKRKAVFVKGKIDYES